MHLFTYGTLMFPAVWRAVVGREFPTRPASAAGFCVTRAQGELFPVMYAGHPGDVVRGLLYVDVDDATMAVLDEFESTLYERVALSATLADGGEVTCHAYLLPERNRRFASDEAWTREWFERAAMEEYLRRIEAWSPQ